MKSGLQSEYEPNFWFNSHIFYFPEKWPIATVGYLDLSLLAMLVAVEGPIATLLGAAAASAGLMHLEWVFIAAATGNLIADLLWYTLGRMGKIQLLLHLGQKIGINRELLN